ncbi:hypothetical protein GCM10009676_12020 [Prauserella halophila]|uniref:Uncharacterized protein n=1 Tax=Prauserella halophila TaxID=185641 RepID=A0ABN1W1Y1_9PSEU|nr:hypothetical protein [Prauserella halophila]MCP2236579.1 hypothetical protein [Prauserella halophila]
MLYIVLILVLGALGLVVAALITADSLWAWVSLGVSVLAAILLVIDWWRRRSAGGDAKPEAAGDTAESDTAESENAESENAESAKTAAVADSAADRDFADSDHSAESADDADNAEDADVDEDADAAVDDGQTELIAVEGDLADPDDEPATEDSSAADARLMELLEDEVVVVDERPRYHLGECTWLQARETIPLPAREARELGFSPCGRCSPDATLAARHRDSAGT